MLNETKTNKIQSYMENAFCRFCNSNLIHDFLDLGKTPLANSFLTESDLEKSESTFPLHAYVCDNCFLVQLSQFETPQNIFSHYAYFSSYSSSWLKHAKNYVDEILSKFVFDEKSLVIELASNDGYLLQFFKKKNISILGIEPAKNVAEIAIKNDIPTTVNFFSESLAIELKNEGKQADLIIANNVLAHVPELNDFVKGIKILLKNNGIATIEFPHLLNLIQKNQFDTIYHEHFSYFSLFSVLKIFLHHDMEIFDVDEIPTHGGSLRLYIKHIQNKSLKKTENIQIILNKEIEFGLDNVKTYKNFFNKTNEIKDNLLTFLNSCKKNGKTVVGYGAPAKGNTMLNFCNVGKDLIPFTVDKNTHKQGLYLPGTHIPIKSVDEIKKIKPDFLLILPWNLKEEIMEEMDLIRDWGGKFVVPIPELEIL